MMSMRLFELLDYLGRKIRKKDQPFGGIQVIFSGDFYQLPPVPDRDDPDTAKFCFESPLWSQTFKRQTELRHNYRQSGDASLVSVLNQIRQGFLCEQGHELLVSRLGHGTGGLAVKPTQLFPRKYSVELINQAEMSKLAVEDEDYLYEPVLVREGISPRVSEREIEEEEAWMTKHGLFDELVHLKKGAQVMCTVYTEL